MFRLISKLQRNGVLVYDFILMYDLEVSTVQTRSFPLVRVNLFVINERITFNNNKNSSIWYFAINERITFNNKKNLLVFGILHLFTAMFQTLNMFFCA